MDRTQFNDHVRQLNRRLFAISFRILRKHEEAEDAVQEVFIKLWNMGDKLDNYRSIDALATTMTKNYCIDQVRKQKNFLFQELDGKDPGLPSCPSPFDVMVSSENQQIIRVLIQNLPDMYRDILNMRDIEGLSYEEISEKTGQNINTLRVNLSRARIMLRNGYNKQSDERKPTEQITPEVL